MMKFKKAENGFKRLKTQFETGTLTEPEFKTQLEKLMIRDEQGNWWMIGYETELWYRHNGINWVRTDLPPRLTSGPKWVAIFWITLVWAIGWTIGTVIKDALAKDINEIIALAIGGAIGWAIGGLLTAIILRIEDSLSDWKSMLWITLAWAISGAIGWTIGVTISGAIGGLLTAIILRIEDSISDWKSILWITLAWIFGMVTSIAIWALIFRTVGWAIGGAISGAIGGAIGGFVLIWQIRKG